MTETVLTIVTFEPDWCAVYIDGELYDEGHDYKENSILRDIVVSDNDIDTIRTAHMYPDTWKGTPDTVEELEEMYGN